LQPQKILVVDDSRLMRTMYEVMLRQYALTYADDGRRALEQLEHDMDIDLVSIDLNAPNMSALEFLREVRTKKQGERLQIMIVSSEGREEDAARGLQLGAQAVIKKPFHAEELRDAIANLDSVR
jgi:DNA-binding response OmpR family regulator